MHSSSVEQGRDYWNNKRGGPWKEAESPYYPSTEGIHDPFVDVYVRFYQNCMLTLYLEL